MKRTLVAAAIVAGCGGKAAAPPESVTNARTEAPACLADALASPLDVSPLLQCPGEVDTCRAACDGGDLEMCVTLAYTLERDVTTRREGFAAYGRACEGGVPIACTNYGSYILDGIEGVVGADPDCAHRIHRWSCEHEEVESWGCGMVGLELLRGQGTVPDLDEARRVLEQACDVRGGFACDVLGTAFEQGALGGDPDPERARALYQRGCDTGNPSACEDLERLGP
jgi:TPR repeat protein